MLMISVDKCLTILYCLREVSARACDSAVRADLTRGPNDLLIHDLGQHGACARSTPELVLGQHGLMLGQQGFVLGQLEVCARTTRIVLVLRGLVLGQHGFVLVEQHGFVLGQQPSNFFLKNFRSSTTYVPYRPYSL